MSVCVENVGVGRMVTHSANSSSNNGISKSNKSPRLLKVLEERSVSCDNLFRLNGEYELDQISMIVGWCPDLDVVAEKSERAVLGQVRLGEEGRSCRKTTIEDV